MKKPLLACFATVQFVSDESILIKPDATKKVIWAVPYGGSSLLKESYVDPNVPAYVGQYVGVVSVPNEEYRTQLEIYDANSPIFLGLVAEELAEIAEKENSSGAKAR